MVVSDSTNLVNIGFKNFSVEDKRYAFILLDLALKRLHSNDRMVTSFDPKDVYLQNGIYFFNKTAPISNLVAENKQDAIKKNILGLANLAFCSYLPDYELQQGLLSLDVISQNFNDFMGMFAVEDRNYYRSILVDLYKNDAVTGDLHYSDFVVKNVKGGNGRENGSFLVKATAAGAMYAKDDNQAGFGNRFFLITVVSSLIVCLAGIILYFANYLG